jgi:hypothetical protein
LVPGATSAPFYWTDGKSLGVDLSVPLAIDDCRRPPEDGAIVGTFCSDESPPKTTATRIETRWLFGAVSAITPSLSGARLWFLDASVCDQTEARQ